MYICKSGYAIYISIIDFSSSSVIGGDLSSSSSYISVKFISIYSV